MNQVEYDFRVMEKVLAANINPVDMLLQWHEAVLNDGDPQDDLEPIIYSVLKIVGAMDRPQMLARFRKYASDVLNENTAWDLVEAPQVRYDFGVYIDAATNLDDQVQGAEFVELLRSTMGKVLLHDDTSPIEEMEELIAFMAVNVPDRPLLLNRMVEYLLPFAPSQPEAVWVDDGEVIGVSPVIPADILD